MNHITRFKSPDQLAIAAAEFIIRSAQEAIQSEGRFTLAISGGNTPSATYALLAKPQYVSQIEWKNVFIFWVDERCVPHDNKENNSFNAKEIWLSKVPIPAKNIFTIPVELPPADAANQYEQTIKKFFKLKPLRFDLLLLGMGNNGHTASLFPHTSILHEKKSLVKEVFVKELNSYRISFTAPLINDAKQILFLVTGKEKEETLEAVLKGKYEPEKYPAQLVSGAQWFVSLV